ncbi:S41 family peptidase [Pelagibaculum spongiae]|uniref:S41 family peptidase n=1 Tax=Pelagibaculum spongiae TaxID=2080658 RepID=UPI0019D4E580|nr:S41 family peptidase [Pelagibaculum spongiae]
MQGFRQLISAALISLLVGAPALAQHDTSEVTPQQPDTATTSHQLPTIPLNQIRAFSEAFEQIRKEYVDEIDEETLLERAIAGMLNSLDPHSTYLKQTDFEELRESTQGEFGGLGIEITADSGFVKVISPMDDTPADKAGVMAGDLIIQLNDTSLQGLSLNEAVEIMRGKAGEPILLTIMREGEAQPLKITVVRDIIKIRSVKYELYPDDIGYVRISQFQENTGDDLNNAIDRLAKKNDAALKGLILDLRNNPGGVLSAAIDVSDTFLEKGLIVYTQGRQEDDTRRQSAKPGDRLNGAPVIVLINGGSASASEIVAGALQDHHRAIILGSTSFGKGSVQSVLPLSNGEAIKLTTARYFTPNGRSIQAQGIEPDIEAAPIKVSKIATSSRWREKDLKGHLENQNGDDEKDQAKKPSKLADAINKDFPLHQALNLLRGMMIIR